MEMTHTLHIANARIWTANHAQPWAQSITIVDGVIRAVDQPPPSGADVIDLARGFVCPGFIDAHLHLLLGGLSLGQLDLSHVGSREEFEFEITRAASNLPSDRWLIAHGWSEDNWIPPTLPDKSWMAAAGDRPVVCYRHDHHAVLVNDAVLAQCDLHANPPGARIVHDEQTGEPTGLMVEAAAWHIVNPTVPKPTQAEKLAALDRAQRALLENGVTSVGTMEYRDDLDAVLVAARDRLQLRCQVILLDRTWPLDIERLSTFDNDDRLAVIGMKAFIDGTLGSRTARMLEDYSDDPGNRGEFVELARDGHLRAWIRDVAKAGLSPCLHAIGDAAVREALDVIEELPADARARCRIEHAQHIHPDDLPRFNNLIASVQPLHKAVDARMLAARVGEARLKRAFPFRSLADHGAMLVFGSDWPVVSCDPLEGMRAAVTGRSIDSRPIVAEQNVSIEEALRACTIDAARACNDDRLGALRLGALGDLVVLDQNPFDADWVNCPPRVVMTIVGGRIVVDARQASNHAHAVYDAPVESR